MELRGRILGFALAAGFMLAVPSPGASAAVLRPVTLHVAAAYDPLQPVTIAFAPPGGLPRGGYYYAAAVRGPGNHGADCAASSDMARTPYGYPRPKHWVTLTLYAAASSGELWCQSGAYEGAVYAVPHPPRCNAARRCAGSSEYEECSTGAEPCVRNGVLTYQRGQGLPKPIDRTARIVARFTLRFPEGPPSVPAEAQPGLLAQAVRAATQNGDPHPTQIEAVRTTIGAWQSLNGDDGTSPFEAEQVYLVVERGHFVCNTCTGPPHRGATAPHAGVIALLLPIAGGVTGFALPTRYPDLGLLGDPVPLGP